MIKRRVVRQNKHAVSGVCDECRERTRLPYSVIETVYHRLDNKIPIGKEVKTLCEKCGLLKAL